MTFTGDQTRHLCEFQVVYVFFVFSIFTSDSITDCGSILEAGHQTSGVYQIQPAGFTDPFDVFCDMATDGGGWTVRHYVYPW